MNWRRIKGAKGYYYTSLGTVRGCALTVYHVRESWKWTVKKSGKEIRIGYAKTLAEAKAESIGYAKGGGPGAAAAWKEGKGASKGRKRSPAEQKAWRSGFAAGKRAK